MPSTGSSRHPPATKMAVRLSAIAGLTSLLCRYLVKIWRLHMQDTHGKCSYVPKCSCDKDVNRQHVVVFIRTFNHPETSFSCFYNPARHSEIIRDREADVTSHWAKMLLPGVAFLLCILIMLLVWLLRKRNIWVVLKTETADKT